MPEPFETTHRSLVRMAEGPQSAATMYAREQVTLSSWMAAAFYVREGLDDDDQPIDQREGVKRMLRQEEKGSYWRNEVARHVMAIRRMVG